MQDKAIQALTAALAPKAKVLRVGKIQTIDASGLVPGDIVSIRLGDIAPADVKLIGADDEHDQPLQVAPLSCSRSYTEICTLYTFIGPGWQGGSINTEHRTHG